jgi:hypothetical protein
MKMFPMAGMALFTLVACCASGARAQDCTDRVTGGGYILVDGQRAGLASFGAGGGLLHGELTGHLNYVDHDPNSPVRHVKSQTVAAYCIGCLDRDCRRITYSPATVDGVEVAAVVVEVCDRGEPATEDAFRICIPSLAYCRAGVLGGDGQPSGGNVQLHATDPGCAGTVPVCTTLVTCPCFPACPQ